MRNRGVLVALGIGCLVLAGCGVIALVLGVGGITLVGSAVAEPADIELGVIAPANVQVGESFSLLVRVRNLAAQSQTLDSIDITDEYLAGIRIQGADPGFSDVFSVLGYQSHTFRVPIPAGTELIVQFRAAAAQAGDFSGEMDICINTGSNCLTRPLRTVVSP
ncbi:MAG: hypothetical protein ACRDHG_09185 [Anaerolineales bacterium]